MAAVFAFFNEIGIFNQLSTAVMQGVLPKGVHPSHFAIINHLARTGDGKTPVVQEIKEGGCFGVSYGVNSTSGGRLLRGELRRQLNVRSASQ